MGISCLLEERASPYVAVPLPNCKDAIIPNTKLTDYLLSDSHPTGKTKARFLFSLGFSLNSIDLLKTQLREIACDNEITDIIATPFGTKYVVDGTLRHTGSLQASVRTIWIIEVDQTIPRFITAYPLN